MKLEALQEFNAEVTALGARIVVLTPELERYTRFPEGLFHPLQHAGCSENKGGHFSRLHWGYLCQPRFEPQGLDAGDI
jgi:hypothetical protein